ncbi:hypothetical protein REC12_08130 [Desulfosporosinus sp. PR]|uniref:hypothetical protein n=1 Tax=Candidatus Desulfosporosinus nitrosoreducens TaxID=3401928 RepID=UPI0027F44026|nr:hypothetical protein [Desulfosporosinus sp. PR]MDQ7093554.1 hypothetical protein [Desulfosporosinus sp. PR]
MKLTKTSKVALATAVISLLSSSAVFAGTMNQTSSQIAGGLHSRLDSLVSSGTLTSDQETAIENAMPQKSAADSNGPQQGAKDNGIKTVLDKLVTAGTITQAQEDAILAK